MLEVRLLGQFEVRFQDEPIEIPSRPAQSLLSYLILRAGTAHRREKLAGMFWPESDESNARSSLRHALWRLRKAIGERYLDADKISVAFDASTDYWLDAQRLEESIPSGTSPDDLSESLAVYGGELLPGFYEDWVVLDRERLRAVFEQKVQVLLDRLVEAERWQDVIAWGERWIALGQVPEQAYRGLMMAHAGLEDVAGVAAVYQRCRQSLRAELGVEPSERTEEIYAWLSKGGKPKAPVISRVEPSRAEDASLAVRRLLDQWQAQGLEVLDVASLAIVHAAPADLRFDQEQARLLIHSALSHGLDVEPWLERSAAPAATLAALETALDVFPAPRIRLQIVETLKGLQTEGVADLLLQLARDQETPVVRSEAAVAAAKRGMLEAVVEHLQEDIQAHHDLAALSAFVAVADELGLPEDVGPYPKLQVGLALAQRRWKRRRELILRRVLRGGIGGALAMAVVANLQILPMGLWMPEAFRQTVEVVVLPIWIVSNTLLGLFWGGLQGSALGLALGLADGLAEASAKRGMRFLVAGLAGQVHALFLILLSLVQGLNPEVEASVYIPVYVLYGLLTGAALSLAVPPLGATSTIRTQLGRALVAMVIVAPVSLISARLVYGDSISVALIIFLMHALVYPLGLALAFCCREESG